jgi:hypothetical protein
VQQVAVGLTKYGWKTPWDREKHRCSTKDLIDRARPIW